MDQKYKALSEEIQAYWGRRAPSYSEEVNREMRGGNEAEWLAVMHEQLPAAKGLRILDVGTGPGFFAIALTQAGHRVTAIDFSEGMLEQARANAARKGVKEAIEFQQMDAQQLNFADNSFDAVVSRDLTWNLPEPQKAYQEWYRVLKPGGVLLSFDAGWYAYLFDEKKQKEFARDRQEVAEQEAADFNAYDESAHMEEVARKLILSRLPRPEIDLELLKQAGFHQVSVDRQVWRRVWDKLQKLNNASTPCFMLKGIK